MYVAFALKMVWLPADVNSGLGMSGGAIAATVLGTIIAVCVIIGLIFCLKQRGIVRPPALTEATSLGFDNALYNRQEDAVKLENDVSSDA